MTVIHKTPQIQMLKPDQKQEPVQMKQAQQMPYDKYKDVPKKVMEVAEMYESQFTDHLLKEMKKSSGRELGPAEKIYHSMLDSERSKMMAKTNTGLGIKEVVIQEIMQQMNPQSFKMNIPQYGKDNVEMHRQKVEMYKKVNSQKGESI